MGDLLPRTSPSVSLRIPRRACLSVSPACPQASTPRGPLTALQRGEKAAIPASQEAQKVSFVKPASPCLPPLTSLARSGLSPAAGLQTGSRAAFVFRDSDTGWCSFGERIVRLECLVSCPSLHWDLEVEGSGSRKPCFRFSLWWRQSLNSQPEQRLHEHGVGAGRERRGAHPAWQRHENLGKGSTSVLSPHRSPLAGAGGGHRALAGQWLGALGGMEGRTQFQMLNGG